jgi:periplasmic divalent cation tolerance protein
MRQEESVESAAAAVQQRVMFHSSSIHSKLQALWQAKYRLSNHRMSTYSSSKSSDCSIVYITVPSNEVAENISSQLVNNRYCACVNIIPQLTSVYFWENKVQKDSELLLMCKTQSALFPELANYVKSIHPYSVPEVIAVPIAQGSADYLKWIVDSTKKPNNE